jgi:hypothetical protein
VLCSVTTQLLLIRGLLGISNYNSKLIEKWYV